MTNITVETPGIGQTAVFSFKEPFRTHIHNLLRIADDYLQLEVKSLMNMKDMIRTMKKDPFMDIYNPVGLTEIDYKTDLDDEILIIAFAWTDRDDQVRLFHVPLNYVKSISNPNSIEYIDTAIVIKLGEVPRGLDTTIFKDDILAFIKERIGVAADYYQVAVGQPTMKSTEDHEVLESIRQNSATVKVPLTVELEILREKHNGLMARLDEIGIVLGEE